MTDRDLFIAALDKPDPAERAAFLDRACAGDAELRRRVAVLLRAHDQASRFLAAPAVEQLQLGSADPDDPTRTAHPADETAPAAGVDVRALLAPADKPGQLGKLNHYEVLDVVGRGGMGVVLKAFDPKLHRLVAIKLMAPHLAAHGSARKRFEREARAVAAIRNQHVVAIYDVEAEAPTPYLVMEFVGGVSVQDRLEQHGPLDVKAILRIGMQTARGLAAAHQEGIVHRDVKPANILLENGVERVKITDFGLARAADDANLTQSGVITGTPNYMSPEQASGVTVDRRSDLFSLGSVLYALCTGHPPFRAETPLAVLRRVADDAVRPPREVNPDIPDWLDAIIRKLLAKSPADRFQTATEVAELLGQLLAHLQQPDAVPMPAAVPVAAPKAAEEEWKYLAGGIDHSKRIAQMGLILSGITLVVLALFGWAAWIPASPVLVAAVGVTVFVIGALIEQRWEVPYKGRVLRFENSAISGEKLFVDGTRIAAGGFGIVRFLRGTIPAGAGSGDEIGVKVSASVVHFGWLMYVREGRGEVPPAPSQRDDQAAAASPPAVAPTSPAAFAWLVAIALVAAPALLFWTHESFWEGYFRPGYVAPVYMLVSSGLLLAVLWWCRRQSEPRWYRLVLALAMAAVIGGTLIGLLVSWGEGSYLDKLGGASTWHNGGLVAAAALMLVSALVRAVRWLATRPVMEPEAARPAPPAAAQHGPTAFALGAGFLVLIVGFVVSLFVRDLVTPEGGQARTLAFLMGIWGAAALLAFGPGVFIARQWWRKRLPSERRADRRAAILAGLGIGATIVLNVMMVVRTPALREELFGSPAPAQTSLGMNWNRDLIARVTLERDGAVVEEFEGKVKGVAGHYPPGRYTVRGFKDDREVYREEFTLEPGESRGVNLLEAPMSPGYATLRVDCQDPTVTIEVRGSGHNFQFSRPGTGEAVAQGLKAGVKYRIGMARGQDVFHVEDVRLGGGEERVFHIPPVVRPERTIELKPKSGSFPADVTRMEIAPDRSALAVGRLDGPILVFDAATGRERFRIDRPRTHCTAFGFTPDGKRLAYLVTIDGGGDHVLSWVDAGDGEPAGKDLRPQPGRGFSNSHALAYSPDGKRLAVSSAYNGDTPSGWQSRVLRWEVSGEGTEFRELEPLPWWDGMVKEMRFTAGGSELLTVSGTAVAVGRWWENEKASRLFASARDAIDLVTVGKEHAAVAGWNADLGKAGVSEWSPPGSLRTQSPPAPPMYPVAFASLAFSPDDGLLAAGTKGVANLPWEQLAAVHVWDAKKGQERAVLLGHTDWVLDVAFAPDGKGLVTAGKDGTVRTWRLP
jgi:tRNA A-37 threonylcarbamoyl transferase component Bud32